MRWFVMMMLMAGLLPYLGCDVKVNVDGKKDGEAATSDESGTSADADSSEGDGEIFGLNLPGVKVNVNEKDGVSVRAPGVGVDVNEKDGVKVNAPGTDVEVKPGSGN